MTRYKDIKQLQQILLMRKIVAYLMVLKYLSNLIEEADETGQINSDYIYLGSTLIARVDEWWEGMPLPQAPTGLNLIPGDKQLTVSWNANQEPMDGYKVYWGTASGNYTSSVDVGDVATHTITGLTNGTTYYVSVTSYADLKETYFYHTDHLGTPILMTNGNGTIVWEGELLQFGERNLVKGSVTNNLGFPGQYSDVETGLYYNWWRYFNDKLGRYDSFDPILHPANGPPFNSNFSDFLFVPAKLNPFVYTLNNPIAYSDPTGLKIKKCYRPLSGGAFIVSYHQYLIINNTRYGYFDDSTVHKNDPWDAASGWGVHCVTIREDNCKDQCVLWAIASFNPPHYSLTRYNCWSWVSDILGLCGL